MLGSSRGWLEERNTQRSELCRTAAGALRGRAGRKNKEGPCPCKFNWDSFVDIMYIRICGPLKEGGNMCGSWCLDLARLARLSCPTMDHARMHAHCRVSWRGWEGVHFRRHTGLLQTPMDVIWSWQREPTNVLALRLVILE